MTQRTSTTERHKPGREDGPPSTPVSEVEASPLVPAIESAERRERTLEAEFLHDVLTTNDTTARQVIEIFENASEMIEKIDVLLVRHALKNGFDRERAFESFGNQRFEEVHDQVARQAEALAATYFLNPSSTSVAEKYAAIITTVNEFIDLMRAAQREGDIPGELSAKDAFKLIAQNITALALQDKGCEATTILELDAQHLTEHDIRGCMQLADTLSEHGCSLSALDKLLLHQSMVYHCVGYMVPPVLDAVADKGVGGKQLGIPMLAAHYIRSQYEDAESVWRTVFNERAFELLHRAVLYQDKGTHGSPDLALQVTSKPDNATRAHNIEAIIRIAHRAVEGHGKK